ncbi:MAG: hypothetical protein DMG34_19035, partial [Acidobacteria bacterium]
MSDEGWSASVSPDGSQIVFLKAPAYADLGQEVWVMGANGGEQKKPISVSGNELMASPVWSPDGRSIAYVKSRLEQYISALSIELFDLDRGTTRTVLSDPRLNAGLQWLADGRLLYTMFEAPPNQYNSDAFVAKLNPVTARFEGPPVRITIGDG